MMMEIMGSDCWETELAVSEIFFENWPRYLEKLNRHYAGSYGHAFKLAI
jgi:inactivated superfamily I helicase